MAGTYKNKNNEILRLNKSNEIMAKEFFYENMWLKDKIRLESFVNKMLIPLQNSFIINNTIKNLLFNNGKYLLAPEYNDILNYEEIINVWHTMYENFMNNNINITITYWNYEQYQVRTASPDTPANYTDNIRTPIREPIRQPNFFGGKKYILTKL